MWGISSLSLLAPALNECGINGRVIVEVLRDFDIYAGGCLLKLKHQVERERETIIRVGDGKT